MVQGHGHGAEIATSGARHRARLAWALGLTAVYAVVQVVGGLITGSLALLSDAAHMWTDVVGLALALGAVVLANRASSSQRTFGAYRLEVLAAVVNGLLLFGAAIYVLVEAVDRLSEPPDIAGVPVLIVGTVGLLVNVVSMRLLAGGSKESLNVRGAYLEVMADMIGSVGVIVSAIIVLTTGWGYADVIVAAGIGLLVLPRTYRLMRQALRILMETAPPDIDVLAVERLLRRIDGVTEVHDLHIWTITSGVEAASAHVTVAAPGHMHPVLDEARSILAEAGVDRVTVQVEPETHADRPEVCAPEPETGPLTESRPGAGTMSPGRSLERAAPAVDVKGEGSPSVAEEDVT